MSFAQTLREIFRAYETDNVPSTGAHVVVKSDVQAWGDHAESALAAYDSIVAGDAIASMNRLEFSRRRFLFTSAI